MAKYQVYILSVFSAIAAICLLVFQLYWLYGIRDIQIREFKNTAGTLLDKIIADLENREFIFQMVNPSSNVIESYKKQTLSGIHSIEKEQYIFPLNINDTTLRSVRSDGVWKDVNQTINNLKIQNKLQLNNLGESGLVDNSLGFRRVFVEDIAERVVSVELKIEERISLSLIDSLIKQELVVRDMVLDYQFEVADETGQTVFVSDPKTDFSKNTIKRLLFPSDPISKRYFLSLQFPHIQFFYLQNMGWAIILSLALFCVIGLVFAVALTTVFRQRKIVKITNNFVSNITHELKTPIASISLASEILLDPNVQLETSKVEHKLKVINTQVKRLSFLVERVLHSALSQNGKLLMHYQEMNLHKLLLHVIQSFDIQVEQKDVKIETYFNAKKANILIDEVHFSNVLSNLIDNAIKYSNDKPTIKFYTSNEKGKIKLEVKDNGVGIKQEDIPQIFQQFYRVSTGNKHDIKGFGLGLSYVKGVIKEMDGEIWVESTFGKGSSFFILLPLSS